jgi:Hypervirulence associated proteins TUDOR domain
MANEFKRGDRVEWNYRGTTVRGRVRRRLTERAEVGGQVAAATREDPRYVVRVDSSGKEIARRPAALKRVS